MQSLPLFLAAKGGTQVHSQHLNKQMSVQILEQALEEILSSLTLHARQELLSDLQTITDDPRSRHSGYFVNIFVII